MALPGAQALDGVHGVVLGAVLYGSLSIPIRALRLAEGVDRIEPIVLTAEAALLLGYLRQLRRNGPVGARSVGLWLGGPWRIRFWGGIVGLALSLPFVLVFTNLFVTSAAITVTAAISVLAGGFLLRCGVLAIGIPKAAPFTELARWRGACPAVAETGRVPLEVAR